jgi:hypothetical protein
MEVSKKSLHPQAAGAVAYLSAAQAVQSVRSILDSGSDEDRPSPTHPLIYDRLVALEEWDGFAIRQPRDLSRRLDGEHGAGCDPLRHGAPEPVIATARDSWSRMVPPPRLKAPGQQQAQASVSQQASFSSQSASSASPPAGPREPGWA